MTGNIGLLGFGIAGTGGLPVVAPLVSLASFQLGAGAGGVLVKRLGSGKGSVRRSAAVAAMLIGALVGALLLKASVWLPLGLAALIALATWLAYVPIAARLGGQRPSDAPGTAPPRG
jgi:hypothetical protein